MRPGRSQTEHLGRLIKRKHSRICPVIVTDFSYTTAPQNNPRLVLLALPPYTLGIFWSCLLVLHIVDNFAINMQRARGLSQHLAGQTEGFSATMEMSLP